MMGDACCAHDEAVAHDDGAPTRFWQIREVQAAAVAGVLLAAGLATGAAGADGASVALFLAALAIGGWTFVPETLRALLQGRLGVGTLMTIAAAGAVALGELGEAASLAFLFSISEALEGYAMARTRRGLRALLALVPERVTVRRVDVTLASMRRTISNRSDTTLLPSLPTARAQRRKMRSECQGRPPVRAREPSTSKCHASLLESKRGSL